jgi:hypothetical protein
MNHSSPPRALSVFLKLPGLESPVLTPESPVLTPESPAPLDQINIYGRKDMSVRDFQQVYG